MTKESKNRQLASESANLAKLQAEVERQMGHILNSSILPRSFVSGLKEGLSREHVLGRNLPDAKKVHNLKN
jgi:hypothetical protein